MAALSSLRPGYRAVVIGASGGIGGAMVGGLAADPDCAAVYAASRSGAAMPGAAALSIDITDPASIADAAARIGADGPVDAVIVASGLLHDDAAGVSPEKSWKQMDPDAFARLFAVNATGPMLAVQAMLPHVPRDRRALIGVIGARVGSISDNRLGGWYGYRASKAALAMLTRTLAIDLARSHPQLCALMLHPGTVETDLSAPFRRGAKTLFTPAESAGHLLRVLDGATPAQSGEHRAWDGALIAP